MDRMKQAQHATARVLAAVGVILACAAMPSAAAAAVAQGAEAADTNASAALRAQYTRLGERLAQNAFGKPLYLESSDGNGHLKGDVYGVIAQPFPRVEEALEKGVNWCDILILPFNTKHCQATPAGDRQILTLYVGKKGEDSLDRAFRLDFQFLSVARTPDYLKRVLKAASGPVGTRDYDITLEATPIDAQRTFIHLAYSYSYGTMSKIAMMAYLNTSGSGKVGFTSSSDGRGKAQLVSGMRGVMERNVMRYFLAIEAYLDSLALPPSAQLVKRLNDWFTASEKYPRQLHEMDRWEYLALKQVEARRPRLAS
jgi:hypothetical protein